MSFILLFCKSSYSLARHQANLGLFTWPNPLKFSKLEEVILVEVQVVWSYSLHYFNSRTKNGIDMKLGPQTDKKKHHYVNNTWQQSHDGKIWHHNYLSGFSKKKRAKMLCFYVFHLKITKNENWKQNCEQNQKSWTQLILHLFKLHTISVAKLLFWKLLTSVQILGLKSFRPVLHFI